MDFALLTSLPISVTIKHVSSLSVGNAKVESRKDACKTRKIMTTKYRWDSAEYKCL